MKGKFKLKCMKYSIVPDTETAAQLDEAMDLARSIYNDLVTRNMPTYWRWQNEGTVEVNRRLDFFYLRCQLRDREYWEYDKLVYVLGRDTLGVICRQVQAAYTSAFNLGKPAPLIRNYSCAGIVTYAPSDYSVLGQHSVRLPSVHSPIELDRQTPDYGKEGLAKGDLTIMKQASGYVLMLDFYPGGIDRRRAA